jgi:5-methylcytosine-specific restriction endonuclease McrA
MRRNPEKAREAMRRWREGHRDEKRKRDRERSRSLYRRDPEGIKARLRAYWEAHPEGRRAKDHRYRARRRNASGVFTGLEWAALLESYGHRCGYCGASGQLQADHRIPLSRGGTNSIANIIPACGPCNQRKQADTETEYRERLARDGGNHGRNP